MTRLLIVTFSTTVGVAAAPSQTAAQKLLVASSGSNQVLAYDGVTGQFQGVFASGGGLLRPQGLTFGPDGNLYVTGANSSNVVRFDGQTGRLIDVFVTPGSGGLSAGVGLSFGADGNLYVSSHFTGQVL